jgi:hypothetical protein
LFGPTPFDAVAGFRNGLTATAGTPARTGEPLAFAEDEVAILTGGGLHHESQRPVARHSFDNVTEMFFHLSLANAYDFRDPPRR